MDLKDIKERFHKRIKESIVGESIEERAVEIDKLLTRGIQKGRYPELKDVGADLKYVAYMLAITEHERDFVKKVLEKRKKFKNHPSFTNRLEKNRIRILLIRRIGKELLKKSRKYPEWYLDRVILDLGSHFEAISPICTKQAETRRQYDLIARLLCDFGLFKQEFRKAREKWQKEYLAGERVIKRAESISAKIWKEHIQGERERLQKSSSYRP